MTSYTIPNTTEHDIQIIQTNHSRLEIRALEGLVLKKCRASKPPDNLIRILTEVRAITRAGQHDNIAKLLDFDTHALTISLKLEHGQSLDKYVDHDSRSMISATYGTIIWFQMASALHHIHMRNVIHDDVKPDNIMWSPVHQRAVLIDFGAASSDPPLNWFNESGTPSYAAPEYLIRHKSSASDVWGLGITMLFVFGHVPLPDGKWILPVALKEGTEARMEMETWLTEVETVRSQIGKEKAMVMLYNMLNPDPSSRVNSGSVAASVFLDLRGH